MRNFKVGDRAIIKHSKYTSFIGKICIITKIKDDKPYEYRIENDNKHFWWVKDDMLELCPNQLFNESFEEKLNE